MKILSVELENLNSLVGKTKIDFTNPMFTTSGIFAIVGPTGSGKTTILDAICLALYGRTPRLKSISQSENEIMSRGTGFCSAEVVFETNKNGTFLCSWYQQRAGKKPDGNLQKPKHEISEPAGNETAWKPLETKISKVSQIVEEKTGMNFDRFTRSMLLAQGDFDKFLQSDAKDRSEILEQITDTKIYSDISIKVHERNREEENKLRLIEAELRGMSAPNFEEIEEKRVTRNQLKLTIETGQQRLRELTQILQRFERIARLEIEAQKLEEAWKTFRQSESDFQPKAEQLARAMKALELEPMFNTLSAHRKNLETETAAWNKIIKSLPQANEKLMQTREAERRTSEDLNISQQNCETVAETIRRVRELDTKINGFNETLQTAKQQIDKTETDRNIHRKNETKYKKQLDTLLQDQTLELLGQTLEEQEKNTEKILAGKNLSDLAKKQAEILQQIQSWQNLRSALTSLEKIETEKTELQTQTETTEKIIQDAETNRQHFVRKIELAKQNVTALETEWMTLHRIAALEEHREFLLDGKPCPLCGALEHPFANGKIPAPNEIETKLKEAKHHLDEITQKFNKFEIEQGITLRERDQRRKQISENTEKLKQEQYRIEELLKRLEIDLLPTPEIIDEEIKKAKHNAKEISNNITEVEKFRSKTESLRQRFQDGTNLQNKWNGEKNILKLLDTQYQQQTEGFEKRSKQRQELIDQRTAIFGEKNPDEVERQLAESVRVARQALENVHKKRQETENEYSLLQQRHTILEQSIAEIRQTITDLSTELNTFFQQAGFDSEEVFKSARLTPEARHLLETEKRQLESERIQLETRRHENETALANETAVQQKEGEPNTEQILFECKELEEKIELFQQEIGAIDSQLIQYENDTIKQTEKKKEQELQRNVYDLWNRLDDLIGSADGKKYRAFAQGLTFRIMLDHANRQLEKMTDRYRLLYNNQPDRPPLELVVADAYQAGAIRSTKNLSGGESFLVSLALALGLSSMSSQLVRVDSLFLDEGFGTLDEQTLDIALNVLEGLRQEGKQIGVISHVPAIRERIAVQIQVRPVKEKQSTATVFIEKSY